MNGRPKCAVKNCNNPALVLYGSKWICGACMVKVMNKERDMKNKLLEDL